MVSTRPNVPTVKFPRLYIVRRNWYPKRLTLRGSPGMTPIRWALVYWDQPSPPWRLTLRGSPGMTPIRWAPVYLLQVYLLLGLISPE